MIRKINIDGVTPDPDKVDTTIDTILEGGKVTCIQTAHLLKAARVYTTMKKLPTEAEKIAETFTNKEIFSLMLVELRKLNNVK